MLGCHGHGDVLIVHKLLLHHVTRHHLRLVPNICRTNTQPHTQERVHVESDMLVASARPLCPHTSCATLLLAHLRFRPRPGFTFSTLASAPCHLLATSHLPCLRPTPPSTTACSTLGQQLTKICATEGGAEAEHGAQLVLQIVGKVELWRGGDDRLRPLDNLVTHEPQQPLEAVEGRGKVALRQRGGNRTGRG